MACIVLPYLGAVDDNLAFYCACPVIATRKGSMAADIQPGVNGWLVDGPEDVGSLQRCCGETIRAHADRSAWRALVGGALATRVDWGSAIDDYLAL